MRIYDKEVGLSVGTEIVRATTGSQMIVCKVSGLYMGDQGLYSRGFRVEISFVVFACPKAKNGNHMLTEVFRASIEEFTSED